MNILILGNSVSGISAKKLADKLNFKSRIVTDNDSDISELNYADYDLLVLSPGVPEASKIYQNAMANSLKIVSELEFGYQYFPQNNKIIAITGTNGKTTTTQLVTHILECLGKNVTFAGNIGLPLSEVSAQIITDELPKDIIAVIEVSSFQLEQIDRFSCDSGIILNVKSDHLNRYNGSLELYKATKMKIIPRSKNFYWGISSPEYQVQFIKVVNDVIYYKAKELLDFITCKIKGAHNLENVVAAIELLSPIITENEMFSVEFKKAITSFDTGSHRLEKIDYKAGILVINDSKSTNTASSVAAINAVKTLDNSQNIRIILGGLDKDMDFSELLEYASLLKKCYLIGEARFKLYDLLSATIQCELFDNFDSCINKVKTETTQGEVILFSPACASMDMFKNYAHRGEKFMGYFASQT